MLRVLDCIVTEHDLLFLSTAVLTVVLGAIVTMRLFIRARRTEKVERGLWLFLSGLVGGSAAWATHFLAMLAYESSITVSYDPLKVILSLTIAIVGVTGGLFLSAVTQRSGLIELGGMVIGLSIAAMHYIGVYAMVFDGFLQVDETYIAASLIFAAGLGALSTNRIARPVTRFCQHGAAVSLVLTILSLHMIGMAGLTLVPFFGGGAATGAIPNLFLAMAILCVIMTVIALAMAAYWLDMKSNKVAGERYKYLALHDPLTGLPNRSRIENHLAELIELQRNQVGTCLVAVFDLDNFKEINDVHGHAAGDRLLCAFAERAGSALEDGEFIGRFGGDEFIVTKHPAFTKAEIRSFAERWQKIATASTEWNGVDLATGVSIGIARHPDNGSTPTELLARADLAMYRAKAKGKSQYAVYDPNIDEESRGRSALAMDLRNAIANGELELYYQAQNAVQDRQISGFEVLLRWNHPERGMVSPAEFIPIAESSGLIVEIGEWVLRTACAEAVRWEKPYRISVNIAAAQLALSTLPKVLHEILLETGLPASRLELEITESGIVHDQLHALQIVRKLKNLGVSIAMDDYGTGYSSLSTLQTFPFDKIKIDREFIHGLPDNRQASAIVASTVILGDSLDIPVLAEGVETEDHMGALKELGCHEVQGYLFSKPMPVADVRRLTGQLEHKASKPRPRRRQRAAAPSTLRKQRGSIPA